MKFIFDTKYSEAELNFLSRNHCEILSEIRLVKTAFSQYEIPRRMFQYGSEYIGEIFDEVSNQLVWTVLSKRNGIYYFSSYYEDLEVLEQGI